MPRHIGLTLLYSSARDLRMVQQVAGQTSSRTKQRLAFIHPAAIPEAMGWFVQAQGAKS